MRASLAALVATLSVAGCGSERAASPPPAAPAAEAREDVKAHFTPEPEAAERPRGGSRPRGWCDGRRCGRARAAASWPGSGASPSSARHGVLAVTGSRTGWLRVTASERRNGEHGWIRASAARVRSTDVWIRVDRSRRVLTLRRGDRVLRRLPVAVGRPGHRDAFGSLRGHRPAPHA